MTRRWRSSKNAISAMLLRDRNFLRYALTAPRKPEAREAEVAGHLAREPAVQVAKALLRAPVREGLEIDLSVDQRREDPTAVEAAAQRQDEAAAAQLEAAVDGLLERVLDLAHGAMVDRARPERQP